MDGQGPIGAEDLKQMELRAHSAAELLRAIAHPARLMILCNLAGSERNVNDLCAAVSMPQAQMSQQLARLRQDGLVTSRRAGREMFYRIASAQTESLILTMYELFCAEGETR